MGGIVPHRTRLVKVSQVQPLPFRVSCARIYERGVFSWVYGESTDRFSSARAASPARAFGFDSLLGYNHGVNRLYSMSAPGSTCSGLSWSYDQWGNRTAQTVTGGTCGSSQLTFN